MGYWLARRIRRWRPARFAEVYILGLPKLNESRQVCESIGFPVSRSVSLSTLQSVILRVDPVNRRRSADCFRPSNLRGRPFMVNRFDRTSYWCTLCM